MKYSDINTISGYKADEVISALQKEIRRGKFEEASFFALELLESDLENKLWERLQVIAVEDVADNECATQVRNLKLTYYELKDAKICDKFMQALKAVQILANAKKDRIISELYDYLKIKRKEGYKISIPEYAIDKHTKKGKEQGKDYKHFLNVSAKVNNENPSREKKYNDFLKQHS